jgi:hypothetical protein
MENDMSDSPIQELVTNIVAEYVGAELTKEKGIELAARIVQGVLMTRQGAGLPDKAGRSTQCSANEKSGAIPEPEEEKKPERPNYPPGFTPPEERKKGRTLAVISHPYDDPTKPIDEQDGAAPFAIRTKGE